MAMFSIRDDALRVAIERFVEVAFKSQDSLFTPGAKIWSPEVRDDLYKRFVLHLDEFRGGDFMRKFETLLKGPPNNTIQHNTIQLAAELLYAQLLAPVRATIKPETKVRNVARVLSWSTEPVVTLPDKLKSGLTGGLSEDQSFKQWWPYHLAFILETLRAWYDFDRTRRESLLSNPWEFKRFIKQIPHKAAQSMCETLCFFVHPEHFEAITSLAHKKKFIEEFRNLLEPPTGDDDKDLLAIRKVLSKKYTDQFHFFDPKIRGGKPVDNEMVDEETEDLVANKMKEILEQFGQIILYGPPGTGKTREAKRVALALLSSQEPAAEVTERELEEKLRPFRKENRFDLVVFHPAYEYEQFVGGIEPDVKEGHLIYKAKEGAFLRLCRLVEKDQRPAVLIIDEINRGNLPKLLGELVYALEYRGHEVRLPFSCNERTDLIVPKNIYIIATMNSSDRSIGHIDVAIRRRFGLCPVLPNSDVVKTEWSKVGDARYGERLADLMERVNKTIKTGNDANADAELGVGHSYFLPKPGSSEEAAKQQVQMKWEYQVKPLLREYAQLLNLGTEIQAYINKTLGQTEP